MSLSVTKRFYSDFQKQFPRLYANDLWCPEKKIITPCHDFRRLEEYGSNSALNFGPNGGLQIQNNHEATQAFIRSQTQNAGPEVQNQSRAFLKGGFCFSKQEIKKLSDFCEDGNTEAVMGILQGLKKEEKPKEPGPIANQASEAIENKAAKDIRGIHQEFKKSLIEKVSMSSSFEQVAEWIEAMLPRLRGTVPSPFNLQPFSLEFWPK